jgi:hypothetical protein
MWQEMCKETVAEATIFFTRGWPTGNHGISCKRRRGGMERSESKDGRRVTKIH